jgi:D-alanyl-D-alanine carboxypeptidase
LKKLLLILIAALLIASTGYPRAIENSDDLRDSLIAKLEEFKEETKVKSIIAGVWKGEQEILTIALGESMTDVPADVNMHLRIGGVTETFMGTLVMMLSDQGKFKLDDKISKWLPSFLAADSVTVEMLIKNAGGYKDYVYNNDFLDLVTKEPFREFTREEIIDYAVRDGQLNFTPGTDQKYSHTEFTILANVLEKATGKTLADLYEENIFKPLGLSNTGYCFTTEIPSPVLHSYSKDRGIYEDATFWNPSWTRESGTIYSNLLDLGKWGPIFGKGKLLSEESLKTLMSSYGGLGKPDLYFASGFVVANGWSAQNPSFNGFSGAFGYQPDGEYTVVVYTTIGEDSKPDIKAFSLFQELVKIITPDKPLNF